MHFKTKLSKHDFREFQRAVLRTNRSRFIASLCLQICLWLWILVPFFQLWGMGLEVGVPFGKVIQTYPIYMMDKGYLSPTFFVLFAIFLCCTPTVLSLLTYKRAYANCNRFGQDTVVLSQWRFCLYNAQNDLISAMPYSMIDKVLWLRHSIAVILESGDAFAISTRELDEKTQEDLLEMLNRNMKTKLEMVSPPVPMEFSQDVFWRSSINIQRTDFYTANKILASIYRSNWNKILIVLVAALLLDVVFNGFGLLSTLLLSLSIAIVLMFLPPVVRYKAMRTAKKYPWVVDVLSGEVAITEQGIVRQNQLYYSFFPWQVLSVAVASDEGIVIISKNRVAFFFPAKCFSDKQEMDRFVHWINLKIQKKKADDT